MKKKEHKNIKKKNIFIELVHWTTTMQMIQIREKHFKDYYLYLFR